HLAGGRRSEMVTVRKERPAEAATRDALLDLAYGPARFTKTSERLREGRRPELALVAAEGRRIVGTVQLWEVSAGPDRPALLLGPLAVAPDRRKRGIGSTLMHYALREAARRRYGAVLLVGDGAYYSRFGFSSGKTNALWLPGPYERHRLLGCELKPGALDGARGLISACGPLEQRADLATLVAGLVGKDNRLVPHRAGPHLLLRSNRRERDHPLDQKRAAPCPLRRTDRHDRLRLDRQRHPAADRAAYRFRPLEIRGDRARRQRPAPARRAADPIRSSRAHERELSRHPDPAADHGAGPRHGRQPLGRYLLGRSDGVLQGPRRLLYRHGRRAVAGPLHQPQALHLGTLQLRAAPERA